MVSIIIPTYNREHLIIETLNSISKQTYTNWECILVDDGSTDKTVAVINKYIKEDTRFSIYKRPTQLPKGANACRNYGFKQSKGDYIQFFDSDDLMLSNCLEARVVFLEKENLDFVTFAIRNMVGNNIIESNAKFITNSQDEALEAFIESKIIPWNLQRTLFNKSILKKENLFNTKLQRFQDIDFNIRLLLSGKVTFKMVDTVDCYYRTAGNDNPRQASFYNDVFLSIPEYFKSITANTTSDILNRNKVNLQQWLYHIIALYTTKEVSIVLFIETVKSAKQYIGLSKKQSLILNVLFKLKQKTKPFKGKTRLLKFLKSAY